MKRLLLNLLLFAFAMPVFSQNEVLLSLSHKVGTDGMNSIEGYIAPGGYIFNIDRLEYYISGIELIHDGGQNTVIDSSWILVDALTGQNFSLGMFNITEIEGINFSIGVEQPYNHQDPSLWPLGHPLAPRNPSMHWGWASGYRFAALEGKTGSSLLFTYQIHALGDDNYNQVSLTTDAQQNGSTLTINLLANYLGLFNNLDVSGGLIEHGDKGPAITLLNNFATSVFSSLGSSTSISTPDFEGSFSLGPNPAVNGKSKVQFDLPQAVSHNIILTDMTGREVRKWTLDAASGMQIIEAPSAGIWFIQLVQDGRLMLTEKWISPE